MYVIISAAIRTIISGSSRISSSLNNMDWWRATSRRLGCNYVAQLQYDAAEKIEWLDGIVI